MKPMTLLRALLFLVLGLAVLGTHAQADTPPTTEKSQVFREFFANDFPFYKEKGAQEFIKTEDGLSLFTIRFVHTPKSSAAVFIMGGRGSSLVLYSSLIKSLYDAGFDVYGMEHRGYGHSSRVAQNPQMSHVNSYNDYVADFNLFYKSIAPRKEYRHVYLVTGSMGAAITMLYEKASPHSFDAMVFAAPMFGVSVKPYPTWLIRTLVATLDTLGFGESYAPRQHDYQFGGSFCPDLLTHNTDRCAIMEELYRQDPQIVSGGASYRWVRLSLRAASDALAEAPHLDTPVLVFKAGQDARVTSASVDEFCTQAPHAQCKTLPTAKHDIFNEAEDVRGQAIHDLILFFKEMERSNM